MFTTQSQIMNKYKLIALFFLAVFATPLQSEARLPGLLSRFQLGYSFVSNSAESQGHSFIKSPAFNQDTTIIGNLSTSAAWGFTAGTYFRLSHLGESGILALGVDYMYNLMAWKVNNSEPGTFDGATVQMALPIGLDMKFGADAMQVRDRRFCATLGAGVYPSYAITSITDAPITIDPVFSVAPYLKAEVGIYAGICMKVRAIYAIGDLTYMDYKESSNANGVESSTSTKLVGKSNLTISLLIMPFSFKWQTEDWWNTY